MEGIHEIFGFSKLKAADKQRITNKFDEFKTAHPTPTNKKKRKASDEVEEEDEDYNKKASRKKKKR